MPLFVAGLFILTSCERETASLSELENNLVEIKASTSQLKQSLGSLKSDLQRAEYLRDSLATVVDESAVKARQAESSVRSLKTEFAQYRNDYRNVILRRAPGMELGEINVGGQPFHGVKVKSIDRWEVMFSHSGGMTKFALADLPDHLRELFAFDPGAGPKQDDIVASYVGTVSKNSSALMPAKKPTDDFALEPMKTPPNTFNPALPAAASKPDKAPTGGQRGSDISVSGRHIGKTIKDSNGHSMEVIATFQEGASGGTKVKGAVSPVPEGYRPIGSNFSTNKQEKK